MSSARRSSSGTSEIYSQLLLKEKLGYPLWDPGSYTERGISIGDVGSITSTGQFEVYFNVYDGQANDSHDDSKLSGLQRKSYDLNRLDQWTVLKGGSVNDISFAIDMSASPLIAGVKLSMRTTCSNGDSAILVLPHGASEQSLQEPEELLQHLPVDIIERWQHYTKSPSLLLVTGCVKSRSWGVVEVSSGSGDSPVSLTLKAVKAKGLFTGAYTWQHSNGERHRTQAGPSSPSDTENQYLFLRGYTLSLRRDLFPKSWPQIDKSGGSLSSSRASQRLRSWFHVGSLFNESSPVDAEGIDNKVGATHMSQVSHPSIVINEFLLNEIPEAQIAITHDDDWSTLVDEADAIFPNDKELLRRVKDKYKPLLESGYATLYPNEPYNKLLRVDSGSVSPQLQNKVSPSVTAAEWKSILSMSGGIENYRDLTNQIVEKSDKSFAVGGFSDIFKGILEDEKGRITVGIKIFRYPEDNASWDKAVEHLKRETRVWASLSHPNILPLLGVAFDVGSCPGLISPLCINGNAINYISKHPKTNRLRIIMDVAQGLQYLHNKNIVHGDMKTDNVLIDNEGVGILADFGCSTRIHGSESESNINFAFSVRFTAPELLSNVRDEVDAISARYFIPVVTKRSDTYGFGLVALHILTGKLPFFERANDVALASVVNAGGRPGRDLTISNYTWSLLEDCWSHKADIRPTMDDVIQRLKNSPAESVRDTTLTTSAYRSRPAFFPPPTADELTPYRDLTGQVTKTEEHYFAYGGFSEVFKGEWTDFVTGDVRRVAIKFLRGVHTDEHLLEVITRRLYRETRVWHSLLHANILPFLGTCCDLGPSTALVSPLCLNGSVVGYLRRNPEANRFAIVIGVAQGLRYLHSQDILHGDLKGHNILISDDGTPLLSDVGRSKFIDPRGFTTSFSGSARYLAPELVSDEPDIDDTGDAFENQAPAANLTKETDVYAFSMVTLEILTGQIPYFYLRQDSTVIALVQDGTRPDRSRCLPTTFADPMWALLVDCWHADPNERPNMSNVVDRLEALLI